VLCGRSRNGGLEPLHVLELVEVPVKRGDGYTLVGRDCSHQGVREIDWLGLEPLQRVQHDFFQGHLETTTGDKITDGIRYFRLALLLEANQDERCLSDNRWVQVQLDLSRGVWRKSSAAAELIVGWSFRERGQDPISELWT